MGAEISRVSDEELERLAQERGPTSVEAQILKQLHKRRAKDRQVFAFKVGCYYFVGPTSDARTELDIIDLVENEEDDDAGQQV